MDIASTRLLTKTISTWNTNDLARSRNAVVFVSLANRGFADVSMTATRVLSQCIKLTQEPGFGQDWQSALLYQSESLAVSVFGWESFPNYASTEVNTPPRLGSAMFPAHSRSRHVHQVFVCACDRTSLAQRFGQRALFPPHEMLRTHGVGACR